MVARATIKYAPLLWSNGLVTLREILLGFVLGSAAGLIIGSAISLFKPLERVVYPALVSSQSIPKLAIAPLLVVWFGYGATTIIIVAVLVTVFPVVVNTMLGLQSVSPEMLKLGKVMGGSPLRIFLRIRIPTAMPSVFAGLKLGITNATIGAVVGEFVAASSGLAYLLQDAAGTVKTDLVFATVIVLAVMGVALFGIVQGVEQFVTRKYGGHS
jgi:NitT/TauT family transport system permease protein